MPSPRRATPTGWASPSPSPHPHPHPRPHPQVREAYRVVGRAVAMERRALPHLDGIDYLSVELPTAHAADDSAEAGEGAAGDGAAADGAAADGAAAGGAAAGGALCESFRSQLPAMLAFARSALAADDGELLVHTAAHGGGVARPTLRRDPRADRCPVPTDGMALCLPSHAIQCPVPTDGVALCGLQVGWRWARCSL
jgi:hypothetical protein